MENELPKSGDIIAERMDEKIPYDPNAVFKNKDIAYFGEVGKFKIQYVDFTKATGKRKWMNSLIVVVVFLLIEAVVIANNVPARNFVLDFFPLNR